jgi:hypothetical protein
MSESGNAPPMLHSSAGTVKLKTLRALFGLSLVGSNVTDSSFSILCR